MRTRNKLVLIFFCLLLSAAAVLAGVNIYSELKERQKEKEDFAAVSQIAEPTGVFFLGFHKWIAHTFCS